MSQVILLDNEAVHALADPAHRKHRRVMGYAEMANRRSTRAAEVSVAVPTAVRVEAGWDRTDSAWAFISRLRVAGISLDAGHADAAAAVRTRTRVSVADAHLGAAIRGAAIRGAGIRGAGQVTVLTREPGDMRLVAEGKPVDVVAL